MSFWTFHDDINQQGKNLIMEWYDTQPPPVQAQFDATLLLLRSTPNWEDDDVEAFKVLINQHKGLGEIRFHIIVRPPGKNPHRKRFRPVGIWPPANYGHFIILIGCEKVRDTYTPNRAFDIALKLRDEYVSGLGGISEHT